MSGNGIERIVGYLGRPYADLTAGEILPDMELNETYPGSDSLFLIPEKGLEMDFRAEDKVFTRFYITLKKTIDDIDVYEGELPEIFFQGMDQSMVIDLFGDPVTASGPVLLPHPIGQTGGWASYVYDEKMFPRVELQFQYTADMQVKTVAFLFK
jgi:hypothetical protein